MGACYAAGGKDLDAIGAWQTALIGESGQPGALRSCSADALVRANEQDQAMAILDEGLAAFPDDAGLRRRLGMALRDGRPRARRPCRCSPRGWTRTRRTRRALFATLALLFEGFSRETAGAAPAEEQQRLTRYAKAYVDGKGPNREVIERWLRYLESRAGRVGETSASAPEEVPEPAPDARRLLACGGCGPAPRAGGGRSRPRTAGPGARSTAARRTTARRRCTGSAEFGLVRSRNVWGG